jgi:hypothetical protein
MISAGRSVLRLRRFGGWFGMAAPINDYKVSKLSRLSRQWLLSPDWCREERSGAASQVVMVTALDCTP